MKTVIPDFAKSLVCVSYTPKQTNFTPLIPAFMLKDFPCANLTFNLCTFPPPSTVQESYMRTLEVWCTYYYKLSAREKVGEGERKSRLRQIV